MTDILDMEEPKLLVDHTPYIHIHKLHQLLVALVKVEILHLMGVQEEVLVIMVVEVPQFGDLQVLGLVILVILI